MEAAPAVNTLFTKKRLRAIMPGMLNNVLMVAMLLFSLVPFLPQEPKKEPFQPAAHAVSPPDAASLAVVSVAQPKAPGTAKPAAEPPASPTGPYTEPQNGLVSPQIIYIVNNTMPEATSTPKREPEQVGETNQGWPVYMGTGLYAVEPGSGDHWSVAKNPAGSFVTRSIVLKAK